MPSPIFDAPLTSSLVPVTAGNGTPTFTRATTAYVSAVAAAGNAVDGEVLILCDANEARFAGARRVSSGVWSALYADGSAIPAAKLLGYVAENAATNILPQSQAFDLWATADSVITANTQTAPDGTLTADTFADNATNSFHVRYAGSLSYTSGTLYTYSAYLKAGTLTWAQLAFKDSVTLFWANFNLVTGAVGNKHASVTSTITALPNGWYRCTMTVTSGATTPSGEVHIYSSNANAAAAQPSYVGTGQTMYLWGAQVEQSSDPTSYIPTVAVSVTRNADSLSYPVTSNIDGAVATTYSEALTTVSSAAAGAHQNIFYWNSGPFYPQYYDGATKKLSNYNGPVISTANARILGAMNKNASAWSGATVSVCLNGGAVATGAFTAYATSGVLFVGGAVGGQIIQGSIRNVKFYSTRLTDAQLIQLTTDGFLPPDVVPVDTSAQGGIAGRYRRRRIIEVEIDGEVFPVASEAEGRELLLKAREAAKQAAQAAAVAAAAKAEGKTSPAAVKRALALPVPKLKLITSDLSDSMAQAIQAQVDAAQAAIDDDYALAAKLAEGYVRQRVEAERRQQAILADEEEVIAMILRLP